MAAHAPTVVVPEADRRELQQRARSKGAPAREVERARIVLLAAGGMPGKPSPLPETLRDRVLELTLTEPPTSYGATHWSWRLLAAALAAEGIPLSHVTSCSAGAGHRASDRRLHRPAPPPGVSGLLRQVAAAYPRRQLHVVVDIYATHKNPAVRAWLKHLPWVRLHVTPTSGSWLNLVEAFFSIITRQALRRGSFPTVADFIAATERFIDAWNDRCTPFTWTKDPDAIIAKATAPQHRKTHTTSVAEH